MPLERAQGCMLEGAKYVSWLLPKMSVRQSLDLQFLSQNRTTFRQWSKSQRYPKWYPGDASYKASPSPRPLQLWTPDQPRYHFLTLPKLYHSTCDPYEGQSSYITEAWEQMLILNSFCGHNHCKTHSNFLKHHRKFNLIGSLTEINRIAQNSTCTHTQILKLQFIKELQQS